VTRRTLRLTAAAVLAVLGLAACQTNQGTVAYIGQTRITTAQVEEQVNTFYEDPFWAEQAKGRRATVRSRTVNAMIIAELLAKTTSANGVEVSDDAVSTVEKGFKAEPQRIPQGLQGAPLRVAAQVSAYAEALQSELVKGATSQDEVNARFDKALSDSRAKHPVKVNPRYGKFDPRSLALTPCADEGIRDLPDPASAPQPEPQATPSLPAC
jgi:hypothetical protein